MIPIVAVRIYNAGQISAIGCSQMPSTEYRTTVLAYHSRFMGL